LARINCVDLLRAGAIISAPFPMNAKAGSTKTIEPARKTNARRTLLSMGYLVF
jgi:hypothetical protein